MGKFLMNISRGVIHNGTTPCHCAKRISEANKKWFDTYLEAENYYEGGNRKGTVCSLCFANKETAIEYEKQS